MPSARGGGPCARRVGTLLAGFLLAAGALVPRASAFEYYVQDGLGVQVHGFYEMQYRMISDGYRRDNWYVSQWSHILNLEFEFDLAPDGLLFVDYLSAFARVEGRINCVYKSNCGFSNGSSTLGTNDVDRFGDDADRLPRNFTDGTTTGFAGDRVNPAGRRNVHNSGGRLVTFDEIPPFDQIFALGADPAAVEEVRGPIKGALFAVRKIDSDNPRGPRNLPQGPWNTGYNLENIGALDSVRSRTDPADPDLSDDDPRGGLLLRPRTETLFTPSEALRDRADRFDSFDQNFSENDMFFNRGASQDEGELKELYFDLELFDSRLWLRLGKQSIVWGKTELFRTTDQLNPQDIAVSSLPSLEESRINLWSARGVWSFYTIGPFEDVRLEGAVILDDFEPTDLGFCGEPYSPFLVCGKSAGIFAHGVTGTGLAGEERPENWWNDSSGLEFGARLEWRWDRFSFALTNFWGYNDFPYLENFNYYERGVDPATGRPLDVLGRPYDTTAIRNPLLDDIEIEDLIAGGDPDSAALQEELDARNALREQSVAFHTGNRQLYDIVCNVTSGIVGSALPDPALAEACVPDVTNNRAPLSLIQDALGADLSTAQLFSSTLAGNAIGGLAISILVGGAPPTLIPLNTDPADGGPLGRPPATGNPRDCDGIIFAIFSGPPCLGDVLTDEQEALLGCGPFYGTDCDKHGIDLFNSEFSVIGQRLPGFEVEGPIATRVVRDPAAAGFSNCIDDGGGRFTCRLLGSRGPENLPTTGAAAPFGYDPLVDGCLRPLVGAERNPALTPNFAACDGADNDLNQFAADNDIDLGGVPLRSELDAASLNLIRFLAAVSAANPNEDDPDCSPDAPERCLLVRALVGFSGVQRPEVSARRNDSFGRRDWLFHGGGEAALRYNKRNVLGFSMDFAEDVTKTNWSVETTWIENERFASLKSLSGNEKADVYNLTVSVDRLTFIRFLNQNRTFFFNSQWFVRYVEDWGDDRLAGDGPWGILGTLSVGTAYFQDRLAPFVTVVHDIPSASGGVIASISYRYTEAFSISVGMAAFYGGPRRQPIPRGQLGLANNGPPYLQRTKYAGLSPIAEQDEVFIRLRYTF